MTAPASNMRSLDRSFDVLDALQRAKHPIRLADVARASGLHIATAQRIVNVLVARGYAARIGDGYTAGPASLAVAHAYLVSNPLSALAQPVLQQLATNTGYAASLYVRVEYSRVLIARVESDHPLSYVLPVGERLPLHLGGAGKIFLAELMPSSGSAPSTESSTCVSPTEDRCPGPSSSPPWTRCGRTDTPCPSVSDSPASHPLPHRCGRPTGR